VVGFKPTHGLIPRSGALALSRSLDQVGVFARSVEDAALLAECIVGFDEEDPDTRPVARPAFAAVAASEPPLPPRFAFVRSPVWEQADAVTQEAFGELVEALGEAVSSVELGSAFDKVIDLHRVVMEVEMAHNLRRDYDKAADRLSPQLRQLIERGRTYQATDYCAARDAIAPLNLTLDELFNEYDAILTPAAPGEAPAIATTGSPVFCSTWTYLGTPAITLPLMASEAGLPLGVQLVGRRGNDARLLRTARWLVNTLRGSSRGARPKSRDGRKRKAA
jgi:Asp-tRNA(Asn)/Glu-tRNA(Gln) amidotransferase A subunit family amidase